MTRSTASAGLDAIVCTTHGWEAHAAIHEAGHALLAIARGIPFVSVSVYPAEQVLASMTSGTGYAGGLLTSDADASKWVLPNPEGALDMLMAGVIAERLVLGHEALRGYLVDMQKWNAGVESLRLAESDKRRLVHERRPATEEYLSRHLVEHEAIVRALGSQGGPAVLSEADVRGLVTGI